MQYLLARFLYFFISIVIKIVIPYHRVKKTLFFLLLSYCMSSLLCGRTHQSLLSSSILFVQTHSPFPHDCLVLSCSRCRHHLHSLSSPVNDLLRLTAATTVQNSGCRDEGRHFTRVEVAPRSVSHCCCCRLDGSTQHTSVLSINSSQLMKECNQDVDRIKAIRSDT